MLNLINNKDFQQWKADKCPEYKRKLKLAGRLASISMRKVKTADDFRVAKSDLIMVQCRIKELDMDRDKNNLLALWECADSRVAMKRLINHENPDKMYFFISALAREEKPANVTVTA